MQIGDVVVLKSGGPKMVIKAIAPKPVLYHGATTETRMIHCMWFSGYEKPVTDCFPEDILKLAEEEE